MKIIHVIESSGGSADFVLYLIKNLNNHDNTVIHAKRAFAGRLEAVTSNHSNTKFIFWPNAQREIRLLDDIKAAYHLYKILKSIEGDVIHLHSSKAGFLGRLVCFVLRKHSVLYTPNGLAFLRKDVSSIKRWLYIFFEKIANKLNGEVISCSQSEADALRAQGIVGKFINNGTQIGEEPSYQSMSDYFVVATVGRVTIQKNPALYNSIASHFKDNKKIKFMWIGEGELRHQITSPNVEVTGWLDHADVLKRVSTINLYISTALWEGLPFAVIEAMNLGKPLLLSRCVGNVDLVADNGFLYDDAATAVSHIRHLMDDEALRQQLSQRSYAIAKQHFNVLTMAKNYEKEYIISSNRGKR